MSWPRLPDEAITAFLLARYDEDEARLGAHLGRQHARGQSTILTDRALTAIRSNRAMVAGANDYLEACYWILPLLAAVYSDHPDYREEWRP